MNEPRAPSKRLLVCAVIECLALAVWIGGLVVIMAAVIPAVFNSFGMEQGGRFLTRVFDGYNRVVLAAMAVMGGAIAVRARRLRAGDPPRVLPDRAETLLFGAMVLVASLIVFVLGPQTISLQEAAFGARDESARKAAYDAFFRLHMVVRGLYVANLVLGIWLLAIKLKSFMRKES